MIERLGITGTPGTGKKTIAPMVASELGFSTLDLNSLATHERKSGRTRTIQVDPATLRRRLRRLDLSCKVLYGHLLPSLFRKSELDFIAVLRCKPAVLKERLLRRGYSPQKLRENLEAELIGVTLADCLKRFGGERLLEYDTSIGGPDLVLDRILADIRGTGMKERRWIDWTLLYDSPRKLRSLFSTESTDSALT